MGSAYQEWDKKRRSEARGRRTIRRKSRVSLGKTERCRLIQLGVCLVIFLAVLVGRGVFPEQLAGTRDRLLNVLGMDTDFKAAFANLGRAVSEGEPVLDALGGLWLDTMGGGRAEVLYQRTVKDSGPYLSERTFAAQPLTAEGILAHRFGLEPGEKGGSVPESLPPQPTPAPPPEPTPPPTPEPTPEPTAEPEVIHMDYDGPALPDNATMDKYALGIEVMSPIEGVEGWWVSSGYGWRTHPVDGKERFHQGLDLAVNLGTPVKAFADGVVDYIGENSIYGLYTQIKHDNGVTSFYAHCNALYVKKGQKVTKGDVIAQSGATGNVTGAHLHFELRKDGVLLNPSYYLES